MNHSSNLNAAGTDTAEEGSVAAATLASVRDSIIDPAELVDEISHTLHEDVLDRWPSIAADAPDVAGLLFEDYRQRSLRGASASRSQHEQRFAEPRDSLASLLHRQGLLHSFNSASAPHQPTLALPRVGDEWFGFRLRSALGQGAFASVFLAEQTALADRPVVLKISDLSGHEPQTLAQLQHTHIVPILSVHEDAEAGLRAVCMPYFGGASLSHVLKAVWDETERPTRGDQWVAALARAGGPPAWRAGGVSPMAAPSAELEIPQGANAPGSPVGPPSGSALDNAPPRREHEGQGASVSHSPLASLDYTQACAWIMARLADGLQHAHDRGVLHRDIKPSNILLAADATPMLLDFNLAHDDNQCQAQVEATLGGTVPYMAPEHLRALNGRSVELIRKVDGRSDIYSLGMVLFELVTGHHPLQHTASYSPVPVVVEALAAERSRQVPSLRQFRADVPWGLESIVRTCLQPDPNQRYQRAEHLAEDLYRLLDDRPLKVAPELSRTEQVRKWIRRHPRLASSGVVAALALAVLAAGGAILHATQTRLAATQAQAYAAEGAAAQQRRQEFERGTLQALCLVNTHSDLAEHAAQGREVCERTLALYNVLENPDWQRHPAWQRLSAQEQRRLAEDARELLLLLAGARVRLADGEGVFRQAIALLDRAQDIASLPPSAAVWHARAAYLRRLGDETAARAADEQARAIPPASARDYYLLATTHLQNGGPDRYTQAIRELEQAVRLDPRHYWSWMQKGLCQLETGDLHRATADFGVCVGLWPEFAWGYFNRGFALDQVGDKAAAVVDYTAALARDPALTVAFQNRGVAELELRQCAAALADFDQVVARGRRPGPTLHGLRGQALEALGRHAEADAAFATAFAAYATLAEPLRNQLSCAYGFAVCARLPDEAEHAFRAVPPRDPKYADALYGRGLLAVNRARPEEAVQLFAEALAVRPGFEEAHRYRAVLLARLGRIPEAVTDINAALRAAPKSGATLYAAACVTALAAQQADAPLAARQAADEALGFLRRALEHGYGQRAADDPDLAGLRGHPEFQRLTATVRST